MARKSLFPRRFAFIIFNVIGISAAWIATHNLYRYTEGVPSHEQHEYSKINDNTEDVVGFQVTPNGKKVVYLTIKDSTTNVSVVDGVSTSVKLASYEIRRNVVNQADDAVKPIDEYDQPPVKPFFTRSFTTQNGNVYFQVQDLIEISSDFKVKKYQPVSENLLFSVDEINNKTKSKLIKRIVEKYSKEPIKVIYHDAIYVYLIDLDEGFYIESSNYPLQLDRLPLPSETPKTYIAGENEIVQYGARWDATENRMNEKAVIDKITHTIGTNSLFEAVVQTSTVEINHLLDGKEFPITNNEFGGSLYEYCYKRFLPIDSPSCRGKRIFLKIDGKKLMILNTDPRYDYSKDITSNYDSTFIYVPYNDRFITNDGLFFFLTQHHDLYVYDLEV